MKKQILSLIIFALCACAFGVKLPDGKNVRSSAVTTYPSGALRTVKLNDYWDAEKEGLEISTPIGNMVVYGKICYYEDGSLKSCQPCRNDANKALRVQTNMGELSEFSAGISRDTVSFYQSGALWSVCNARILLEGVKEFPFMKEQVKNFMFNHYARSDGTIEVFAGEFLFYDSGRSDYAIVREAKLEDGEYTLSTPADCPTMERRFVTAPSGTKSLGICLTCSISSVKTVRAAMSVFTVTEQSARDLDLKIKKTARCQLHSAIFLFKATTILNCGKTAQSANVGQMML